MNRQLTPAAPGTSSAELVIHCQRCNARAAWNDAAEAGWVSRACILGAFLCQCCQREGAA